VRELPRIWIHDHDGRVLPVLLKPVTAKELTIHRVIQAELPDALPDVCETWPWPAEDGRYVIALGDLSADWRQRLLCGGELLEAGLRTLAAVHARFAGRSDELRAAGVGEPPALVEPFQMVADSLVSANSSESWNIAAADLDEYARIEPSIEEERDILVVEPMWTLVHNDFHLENIFAAQGEPARILDWESACLQLPAWDLVACPADAVHQYLGYATAEADPDFARRLQAAALVRMQWLLGFVVRSTELPRSARAAAARACVQRVIDASRKSAELAL
jgi:hypothetical protein